ncbi:hypothetical protein PROFUN_08502 [Planoprotostelium fungivorum]|uniref:Methylenetetrahydrofolate reductase (NAD(P)H) n=1 Tax=Planoprotostelium fungivorum TaxID=1890364 RepID=A0A2P6NJA7_9EUKA|nr:hypothetical protein PROFUN_08502 [Planoprotostelium fungivorum]
MSAGVDNFPYQRNQTEFACPSRLPQSIMWYYQNEEKVLRQDFRHKVRDHSRGVCIFGTVPPPSKVATDKVEEFAKGIVNSLQSVEPDGVIVYDIQDEKSRSGEERPFPFSQTHEPREFARLLVQHSSSDDGSTTQIEPIVFRAHEPSEAIRDKAHINKIYNWLNETWDEYDVRNLVLVGGSSIITHPTEEEELKPSMSVQQISQLIVDEHDRDWLLGGITIPERHRDRGNEHQRLLHKVESGIEFFTSQVVYNADNAIWLLRDYDEACKERNIKPVRIIFTFAPFGSDGTVKFLRWLGVEVPDGTMKRVLSRPTLKQRVDESNEICWENFTRILAACQRLKISVPIGVSVECVSKSKMESDGALELFKMLKDEMLAFYSKRGVQISSQNCIEEEGEMGRA